MSDAMRVEDDESAERLSDELEALAAIYTDSELRVATHPYGEPCGAATLVFLEGKVNVTVPVRYPGDPRALPVYTVTGLSESICASITTELAALSDEEARACQLNVSSTCFLHVLGCFWGNGIPHNPRKCTCGVVRCDML
jgi:hypothetical protein